MENESNSPSGHHDAEARGANPFASAIHHPGPWWVRTPQGDTYGPVSRAEVVSWNADGRLHRYSDLSTNGTDWAKLNEIAPIWGSILPPSTRWTVHDGLFAVALATLGWATCMPVFSVLVWHIGTKKLSEPAPRHPNDEALLRFARMAGILHVGLTILVFVAAFFMLLLRWISQ